jgi:hypothetical protein
MAKGAPITVKNGKGGRLLAHGQRSLGLELGSNDQDTAIEGEKSEQGLDTPWRGP